MKKTLTAMVLMAAVVGVCLAGVPFRQTLTVTGGSGSFTVPSDGIKAPYGEAIRVLAVLTPSAAGTTNTIKVIDGTVTNTVATKVVAANDSDTVLTADWWHFAGEKIRIECNATNAFTAIIVGEEI